MMAFDGFDYDDINDVLAKTEKYAVSTPIIIQDIKVKNVDTKGLTLFAYQGIYDGDALTRRSDPLQKSAIASSDTVYVNPKDLLSIGFKPGELVSVEQDGRYAELTLATSEQLPEGSALVYMGRSSTLNLNASELNVSIIGVQS